MTERELNATAVDNANTVLKWANMNEVTDEEALR